MEKEICYKNHDKIIKVHKFLKSKKGKKIFYDKIKLLNQKDGKEAFYQTLKKNWKEYKKIINIFKKVCKNIIDKKLENMIVRLYAQRVYNILSNINTPKQLCIFVYKIINDKNFYKYVLMLYKILSNKSSCIKLLK